MEREKNRGGRERRRIEEEEQKEEEGSREKKRYLDLTGGKSSGHSFTSID